MRRITAVLLVSASMAAFGAVPALAQTGGGDCNEANFQSEPYNNINIRGSQHNQQGSCNVQSNDDTSSGSYPAELEALVEAFVNSYYS